MICIGHPPELARARHMRLARKHLAAILGGVDNERSVPVVPIADLFAIVQLISFDFFTMGIRIEVDIEGILPRMYREPRPGPGRGRKRSGLVVAGPGTLPGTELADVPGGDEHHRGGAGVGSLVKIVVHSFAVT